MKTICALTFCILLAGCGKDDNTRANEKLMKENRERAAREQRQPKAPKAKPAKTENGQPPEFPRVNKAPSSDDGSLGRTDK